MYVDNTNLLHWPESPVTDPGTLIQHVQTATTDYGHLAQATGYGIRQLPGGGRTVWQPVGVERQGFWPPGNRVHVVLQFLEPSALICH